MLLRDKNTGILGYGANLLTVFLSAAAASRFISEEAGQAVGIGGGLYLANRIISENFSPIPKALALSGVGDAAAVGTMGALVPAHFTHPPAYDAEGRVIVPAAYRPAPVPITANAPGMAGRRAG
jgi:hypothetical protein